MQVGQLLQQLAMADDDADPRRKSSLSKFDKVCVTSVTFLYNSSLIYSYFSVYYINFVGLCFQSCVAAFLDVVIGGRAVETPPMSSMNLLEGLSRTVVYITHNQLLALVSSFAIYRIFKCNISI